MTEEFQAEKRADIGASNTCDVQHLQQEKSRFHVIVTPACRG
jgi:hypothetical protein